MKIPALRPEMAALPRGNLVFGSKLKCTIKFTPIRDVGDAAPTAGQSTTLNLIVCSNVKAHGTMRASSPTTTLLAYHIFSTVSIMETAG